MLIFCCFKCLWKVIFLEIVTRILFPYSVDKLVVTNLTLCIFTVTKCRQLSVYLAIVKSWSHLVCHPSSWGFYNWEQKKPQQNFSSTLKDWCDKMEESSIVPGDRAAPDVQSGNVATSSRRHLMWHNYRKGNHPEGGRKAGGGTLSQAEPRQEAVQGRCCMKVSIIWPKCFENLFKKWVLIWATVSLQYCEPFPQV